VEEKSRESFSTKEGGSIKYNYREDSYDVSSRGEISRELFNKGGVKKRRCNYVLEQDLRAIHAPKIAELEKANFRMATGHQDREKRDGWEANSEGS